VSVVILESETAKQWPSIRETNIFETDPLEGSRREIG